uniref:SAM domain-containing protein n=1 Tax=Populus davidiana TaxID=266767 RepID=A0A6M2E9Z5_9ROSI
MYADRVDSAAKTSIKDRLNGNSVADSSRRRQITGKRESVGGFGHEVSFALAYVRDRDPSAQSRSAVSYINYRLCIGEKVLQLLLETCLLEVLEVAYLLVLIPKLQQKDLQRLDDKWEHDLYEDNGPRVSNRKIDAQDLRLKLQRRSLLQASPGSGADLREKLYGTMNSQPVNADLPKIAVAKPSRKSVAVEGPEPEIKKITSVASRKRSQQKLDSSVDVFLQSLGLEKYLITFQAEEVDMTALVHMTDEDLKALGIPMGPRKKIILALESRG